MPDPTPNLILLVQQHAQFWRYTLNTASVQIGSGSHNDITLIDAQIAPVHARLSHAGTTWHVEDLSGESSIRLNQQPVMQRQSFQVGDTLQIGNVSLTLSPNVADAFVETLIDPSAPERASTAFAMDISVPDTSHARIAIQLAGKLWELPLKPGINTIGRAPDNDIVLDHPKVSRQHARIEIQINPDHAKLIDQNSGNGTWVNGTKISEYVLQGSEAIQIGPAVLVYKPAFQPDELNAPAKRGLPGSHTRKPIVFIPGFMGSQLWQGDKMLWPDLKLLFTHPQALMLPEDPPATIHGLVEELVVVPGLFKLEQYSQFTGFLKESLGYTAHTDLIEFAYDWRKDLRQAAQQLKVQVEAFRQTLPDPTTKVILIAHSMGCLVTRYFVDVLGGDQMAERLILMGGPHLGTPKMILALLTGKGLLPLNLINDKIRDAIITFPSAYQLLPIYPAVFGPNDQEIDIFADPRWVQEPYRSYIADAHKFRSELSPTARIPTLCIVGYGNKTINKANISIGEDGRWQNVSFVEDSEGDATIPVNSALLEGAEFHPVQQSHGALFVDNDVKFRLKLELMK